MGSCRSFLFAAPLMLAQPAYAQQSNDSAPVYTLPSDPAQQSGDPRRQGPELDVFRAPATTVAPPPVVAPTVTPTPVPIPVPTPQPSRPNPSADAAPGGATPAHPASARDTEPEQVAPDMPAAEAPAQAPMPQAVSPDRQTHPAPTETQATAPTPESPLPWPWLVGGALALLAAIAFLLLRRRRLANEDAEVVTQAAPEPAPVPSPTAGLAPSAPPQPKPVAPDATDRPWIDMMLHVTQARYSMMGVTIGYSLLLHNRGDRPARDVLVRGLIGNADAAQQALLNAFFTGQSGLPLHSAVTIAPGATHRLDGELRLTPEQVVPIAVGQRSLLIPLAAFDAAYRWGPEDGEPEGHGRTARAFIVGQEQEPPADRLAPFRLDQGARHYRRPAARAAGELTPT